MSNSFRNFFVETISFTCEPHVRHQRDRPGSTFGKLLCVSSAFMNCSTVPKYLANKNIDQTTAANILVPFCHTLQFSPRISVTLHELNDEGERDEKIQLINDGVFKPLVEDRRYFTRSLTTFESCPFNDETIQKYLSKCVNLRNVELVNSILKNEAETLSMLPLSVEDFWYYTIDKQGVDAVTKRLGNSLRCFSLSDGSDFFCPLRLSKSFSRFSKLENLNLMDITLADSSNYNQDDEEVDADDVDEEADKVKVTMKNGNTVTVRNMNDLFGKVIGNIPSLRELLFGGADLDEHLDDKGMKGLVNLSNIQKIVITYLHGISDDSLCFLFSSETFASVGLRQVCIQNSGENLTDKTVHTLFANHGRTLEEVYLMYLFEVKGTFSDSLDEADLKAMTNLTQLSFTFCTEITSLARFVQHLPSVQSLILSNTKIHGDTLAAIRDSPSMQKHLKILRVDTTALTKEEKAASVESFKKNFKALDWKNSRGFVHLE